MKTLAATLALFLVVAGIVWVQFPESHLSAAPNEAPGKSVPVGQQSPMAAAAHAFLDGLREEQRREAMFPFESEERQNWHFTPYPHKGVLWSSLNSDQRDRGIALLKTVLSEYGYEKAREIMALENVLRDIEKRPANDDYRHPERYYFALFGEPGDKESWGWRFEGHHISLNFSSVTNELSVTPTFMGANPARVPSGPKKGQRTLAQEEDLARRFMSELTTDQKKETLIADKAPEEIITGTDRKISLSRYEGLPYEQMTEAQQLLLEQLIRVYLDRMKPRIAQNQWQRMQAAGLPKLHFAWAGSLEVGEAHYYRIHGPTFLLEYDNTQNEANHIHTVWRDPTNDFGEDLLKKHYEKGHHHH